MSTHWRGILFMEYKAVSNCSRFGMIKPFKCIANTWCIHFKHLVYAYIAPLFISLGLCFQQSTKEILIAHYKKYIYIT